MKFLIVTDQRWVSAKIPAIHNILTLCPDIKDIHIAVQFRSLVPEVKDGRITESWFQENLTKDATGYLGVIFVASEKQADKWGLKDGLRGSHFRDGDGIIECWAASDEKSVIRFKDKSRRDRLPKVVAHELAHGFEELGLTDLDVHKYDYERAINNIEGFYKKLKLEKPTFLEALIAPLVAPKESNREHLYQVAYDCLGLDMAPTQDELGCAESVSFVLMKAGVKGLPSAGITGTYTLNEWLKKNLKAVKEPLPGDIIMSATGTGNGSIKNGHVGIVGKHSIMSNNYKTFKWDWHLKMDWWNEYYGKKGGFPVLFYRWE